MLKRKLGAPVSSHVVSKLCGDNDDGVRCSSEKLEVDRSSVCEGSARVGVRLLKRSSSPRPKASFVQLRPTAMAACCEALMLLTHPASALGGSQSSVVCLLAQAR